MIQKIRPFSVMTELRIPGTEAKPTLLSESVSPTAHIDVQKSTSKQKNNNNNNHRFTAIIQVNLH